MKKRINIVKGLFAVIAATGLITTFDREVFAYDFAMTGAYQDGTVTVTAVNSGNNANGFSTLGGYRVDYTLTENFTAFEPWDGCDFYIGNDLAVSGGCQFAYKPNGIIWEQGALNLGAIPDGRSVGSAEPDINGTVRASFQVGDLSEIPNYICYTYQPASGAYLHITDSYGPRHHVWFYQSLKNVPIGNLNTIDNSAPNVSTSVDADGRTTNVNGKTWGTKAVAMVTAIDEQSRPAGIQFYQNGAEIHNCTNGQNSTAILERYPVNANGSYQVKARDQLGNESEVHSFTVDCIDNAAPAISNFSALSNGYCKEAVIEVTASDGGCGLHAQAYSFNGGAWTASNRMTITENGTYTVRVRDALENETSQTITISNIDKGQPVIESITHNNERYCTQNEIVVNARDNESGLHAQAYSFNNGAWTSDNHFAVNENGTYIVRVRDAVGNITEQLATVNNIDREKPQLATEVKNGGEVVYVDDIAWTKEKYAHLEMKDEKSGLKKVVLHNVNDNNIEDIVILPDENGQRDWSVDTKALPQGEYQITLYDCLDNYEMGTITIDHVDCDAPVIDRVTQTPLENGKVRIEVTAIDEGGSGLAVNAYSFDGGKSWQDEPFFDVDENDDYEIVVRDNMDLEDRATETVSSIVKQPDPVDPDPSGGENDGADDSSGDGNNGGGDNPSGDGNNGGGDNPSGDENNGGGDDSSGDGNNGGGGNPSGDGNNGGGDDSSGDGNNGDGDNSAGAGNNGGGNFIGPIGENNLPSNTTTKPSSGKKTPVNMSEKQPTEQSVDDNDYENFHEEDVTALITPDPESDVVVITKEKMEEALSNKDIEVEELTNTKATNEKASLKTTEEKAKRIAAVALATILVIGLSALGLYLILSALHYSCILYAVDDHNKRKRLARLPVKTFSEDWLVEVPNDKLGDLGTGRYVLAFSAALVKEGPDDYVVITIDKNRLREKLQKEIVVRI